MAAKTLPDHRAYALSMAAVALLLASCSSAIDSRLYLPEPMPASVEWAGPAPAEVAATTEDGLTIRGYYWPPREPGGDVILFFPGQSGNRHTAARMAAPLAAGGGVLVASYRGYGDNPGKPDEPGLYADARAFLSLARKLAPNSRLYLLGYSLGAAPALRIAADEEVAGVITVGAFASLADVAPRLSRGLLRDRYDNRASIARVDEPILILHAPEDELVPLAQAYALRDRAPRGVRLLKLEGTGHRPDFQYLSEMIWKNIGEMPRRD
jgi:fermentation-respiration switch protein FrsA (DUF1100 family)